MTLTTEREYQHIGETQCMADHDYDLIHDLSRRLESVWRYDQYLSNAAGNKEVEKFWREVKAQDVKNIDQLRNLISDHVRKGCF